MGKKLSIKIISAKRGNNRQSKTKHSQYSNHSTNQLLEQGLIVSKTHHNTTKCRRHGLWLADEALALIWQRRKMNQRHGLGSTTIFNSKSSGYWEAQIWFEEALIFLMKTRQSRFSNGRQWWFRKERPLIWTKKSTNFNLGILFSLVRFWGLRRK